MMLHFFVKAVNVEKDLLWLILFYAPNSEAIF